MNSSPPRTNSAPSQMTSILASDWYAYRQPAMKYTISGEFHSRSGSEGSRRRGIPTFFALFEGPLQPPPLSAQAQRRRIEKRPDIVKTIPGRRATLRSAGRGSRMISAGSGNIASPRASRPFEEQLREACYAKSPCDHRCWREPDLSNHPQDRVCGSEGRGSERHRRLQGDTDPPHFPRYHLSPRLPVSSPHDSQIQRGAAPLPARGGLRADGPLRGHRPLRTEPAARKRCRCFVEARLRSAAMPFPRRHRRSRNGLDDRAPDLAHHRTVALPVAVRL